MRDIIFRGKRTDNGEWVEGYYVYLESSKKIWTHRIYTGYAETDCGDFYPDYFDVSPSTVGQYTGLTDKNGNRIWAGDVVEGADFQEDDGYAKIKWDDDTARFVIVGYGLIVDFDNYYGYEFEVIGNVFDNQDLIAW